MCLARVRSLLSVPPAHLLPRAPGAACWPRGRARGRTPGCRRGSGSWCSRCGRTTTATPSWSAPPADPDGHSGGYIYIYMYIRTQIYHGLGQYPFLIVWQCVCVTYILFPRALTVIQECSKAAAVQVVEDGDQQMLVELKRSGELEGGNSNQVNYPHNYKTMTCSTNNIQPVKEICCLKLFVYQLQSICFYRFSNYAPTKGWKTSG